uniref:aspartate transaminase n=1 Tax=Varanus komodoensis TaxID=61221 RepID=A0A8D2LKU9_VARKO
MPKPQKIWEQGCQTDCAETVWIPPVVQRILLQIPQDPTLDHEYLPELGIVEFTRAAMELIIGKDSRALLDNRAGGVHTIGGTGAVWIGAEFLRRWYKPTLPIFPVLSDTVGSIFKQVGFTNICLYHLWDPIQLMVDIKVFLKELQSHSQYCIALLHSHALATFFCSSPPPRLQTRHLFPFFDIPAQGLASGNLDRDAWALRHFVERGFELLCAQSFSKIFGLYDERVGNLIVVTKDNETLLRIHSQIAKQIMMTWSGPTSLGGRVIAMVLTSPALLYECLQTLVKRIMLIREKLKEKLRILGTPGSWEHITEQSGVYSFTGLLPSQVEYLARHKHIYLFPNGQINICSINSRNLEYVAQSIHEAVVATTLQDCSHTRKNVD